MCPRLEEPGGHGSLGHGIQHRALDLGYCGSSSSWDSTMDFEWDFRLSHLQMWVKWAYRYVRSSVRWLRGHFLRSKAGSSAFKWWMLCSSFSGLLRTKIFPSMSWYQVLWKIHILLQSPIKLQTEIEQLNLLPLLMIAIFSVSTAWMCDHANWP